MIDLGRIFGPHEWIDTLDMGGMPPSRGRVVGAWWRGQEWRVLVVLGAQRASRNGLGVLVLHRRLNWLGRLFYLRIMPLFLGKGSPE